MSDSDDSSSSSSSDDDYYGPALPPGFQKSAAADPPPAMSSKDETPVGRKPSEPTHIGPVLPPELRAKLEAAGSDTANTSALNDEGNNVPEELEGRMSRNQGEESDSESDSDVIGPLPPDHPKAQAAARMAPTSSEDNQKLKREEWMLIPPKNKIIPGLGLGPRKFLTRTPQDSKNSDEEDDEEAFAREAEEAIERKLISDYDQKMDDLKKDFEAKKRRNESLLEMHQKEMKKKKDEKPEKKERKTFDRDTDLQISGLSEKDKQKYIEKSKELNSKFSRGSRKYL